MAGWTFETSQPAATASKTAGPYVAETGVNASTSAATGTHASAATYSSPAGNGSAHSFSANTWATGDYFQFTLSTTNYNALSFSVDQASSSTGPTSFQLAYSTNGTTFTNFGSAYTVSTAAFAAATVSAAFTHTFDLSSTTALNNLGTVYFRLVDASATGSTGGTDRVDNVIVNGTVIGSGPTLQYFDTNGSTAGIGINGGNAATFDTTTANFTPTAAGTGTPAVYNGSQLAVFGGTSGAVTVNAVTANTGLQFIVDGYSLNGGTLTLGTTPTVEVTTAGQTATINSKISGTTGLTKLGAGTLVLGSTTSDFTGSVTISSGVLSISADSNLGATTNGVVLGGTLQTTAGLTTGRAFTGTGSLDIAPTTVLAATGVFNTTGLTLVNTGTLDLQSSAPSVGALAFAAGGTLSSSTGGTVTITGLTAPNLASTATVNAPLTYAGTSTLAVNVGGGDLVLNGTIATTGLTSSGSLTKTGAGTLELNGANTGLYRVQIGSASASSTTTGGTVVINNPKSLGNNQLFLNSGTLSATTDLTGTNALQIGVSVGGLAGSTTGTTPVPYVPAVISGSNVEFAGATGIYEVASVANSLTINNTTTFSGVVSTSNVTVVGGTIAKGTGFIVNSTNNGSLVLSGGAPNTFTDAVIVGGSATLNLAKTGALAANLSATVNSGATLLLSGVATVTDRINDAATVTVNGGGTLHTGGLSEGMSPSSPTAADGVAGVGALTLTGTAGAASIINFGSTTAGSSLVFSSLAAASKGAYVTILNWGGKGATDDGTATNDRLLFTTDPQFSGVDLANFSFSGFGPGAVEIAYGNGFEIVPVPEPTTVLGGMLLVGAAAWSQRRRWQAARV